MSPGWETAWTWGFPTRQPPGSDRLLQRRGVLIDLTNASAIVTSGAGGFGFATVRRLAQKGAKVVIADVSDERGEALDREVSAGSLYVPTDCMDEDAIAKVVKAAAFGLGPLRAAVITLTGPDWPDGRGPEAGVWTVEDAERSRRLGLVGGPPGSWSSSESSNS